MFTHVHREDVSFRDVKIKIPDRTWGWEWCHAPEVCAEDFGDLRKVIWVEFCLGRRWLTFACSRRPCVWVARGLGQMKKSGVSLSLCWKTLKLKSNKKFCTWTKKSSSVFRVSGFLCSIYKCYEHSMYVSHIHVMVCYIHTTLIMYLSLSSYVCVCACIYIYIYIYICIYIHV